MPDEDKVKEDCRERNRYIKPDQRKQTESASQQQHRADSCCHSHDRHGDAADVVAVEAVNDRRKKSQQHGTEKAQRCRAECVISRVNQLRRDFK